MRNINKVVGMKESGSFLRSIGGAGIKQIMGEAVLAANQASDGTKLFIQGGGNSLKHIGVQNTVRSIVDGVQDIYSANNRIAVSVLGLIPRPRENGLYERARLRTNQCLREELGRLKEDKGIEVLFIDVDKCMNLDCFGKDGVHLNWSGNTILGKIIVEVMINLAKLKRARSLHNQN